jgi:hypothetical protein
MPNWWEQDQYAAPVRRNPFELPQQPNGLAAMQSPQGLSALSPPPQQPSGLPSVEYLRQFAAPLADAPKLPAPPPEQQPGLLSDIGNLLKSGYADTARGLNWLAGKVPGLNQMIDAEGGQQYWGDTAKQAHQNLSQAQQDAGKKTFLNDDGSLGDAWSDPRAYLGTVVESVPGTVMGMGMGGPLTSGLQRVGLAALPRLGTVGAERLAMGAGAVGYGAGEGLIAGGSDAVNARDAVLQRSHDDLQKNSPQYRALLDSMTPDQARTKLAEDVANQVGLEAGLTVAATGAPMGAAFGKLFHGAGKLGNTRLGSLAMGTAGEAGQEFVQSGAEQYLQNKAIQQNVDPSQDRWQGVLNQAVAGALAGGLMGGAMGMGGHGSQTANTQRADEAGKAADQVLAGADQARDNLLNADDRTLTDSLAQLGALAQQGQLPESHQARVSSVMQDIQSELVRRMQRGAPTETGQPGLPGSFDPALGLEGLAPPLSSMGVQAEEQRLNDLGQWQRDGLQREIQRLNETATRRAETQRLERAAQEGRQRMQPVPPTRATPGLSSPILEGEWLPSEASPGSSAIRDQSPLSPLFDALPKPQTTLAQQRAALGQEVDAINQAPAGTSRQGLPSPPARLPERQDKSVQLQRGQSIELSPLLGQPSPKPTVTDAQRANLAGLMGQRPGRHQQSALPAAISPDRPTAQNKPIASQPAAADKTPPVLESPALPAFAKQHADGYLSRLNNVVRDLDSARLTDQKFHGQGRYAADTWTDLKPKVQAVYNEIQDILDSIEDPQNREAYRQYIAERLPKRFVSDQEAAFRGERTADLQTPAWAATPQSQAPLSQEAAHQSQPETSNGQKERQAPSMLNEQPPASTGAATAPQAKQFSVRPTGYPNGGWHVVDQAGVIERFGAPEGKLARWFATDQEALAAADRLNVQANKAASQKTRARVSMPDSNKTSPNLRPERVGGNLPEADPSISLTVAQNETPNSASVAQGKPLRAAPRWNQATHEERTVLLKAAGIAESAIPQRAQQWGKWADIPEGSAKKRLREAIKADTGQHRKTQPSVATSAPIHETQQGNQPEQATAAVVEKALTHGKVKQSQVASAATAVLTMIDTHIQAAPATRKGTETVTIDVPGDGKFKIANSKTALQAFRQKVASSSAFKAQGIAKTPAPASLDQKALSRPKALTEAMLAEFETDKGGAADRHIEKANAWELIKQFGAKYILGDDGFIYTHIEPIAAFPRFAVGRLFDAKASKHSGLKRWHLLDQATGAIAYSADSKAAVLSAIKQNGVAVSPARTVSFSYLQDKVDAARNDLAQKLSVAPTGEAIQAELTRRMDAFADEQYGNDAEQAASESQSSQTKQQPSSLDEAKKDRADPQQTTPDTKDAISPPLNAKDRLLAALDEDIAASSGFDQRDLKAFKIAVERTAPKATDAEFAAAVMDGMTLGEKDAYLRAKEWRKQRNETRATQQQFPDRRYLNVPFAQKDTAKAAGAKWDADRKQWYWPAKNGDLPGSLAEYLDRRFSRQRATTAITPAAARAQLSKALGDTQVKVLERSGRLVIHVDDPTKTGAAGFVDRSGVIHLVASNLENGDVLSVALHEAMHVAADERFAEGDKAKMRLAHAALRLVGLKNFIGNPSFTGLVQEAYRLAATGNKTAQQALAKAQAEYEANPNTDIPQELVAYLAQYADEKLPLARRILSAIRAALFRMGIKIKLSPADIRAFALSALKAQARAATKKAQQRKRPQAAFSQPNERDLTDDQRFEHAVAALKLLARNGGLFQYATSDKKDLAAIAADLNPKIKVSEPDATRSNPLRANRAFGQSWTVTMPDGKTADVFTNRKGPRPAPGKSYQSGNEVYIDASGLEKGESAGSLLYQLVGHWAHNNGKVFIGDPDGISAAGKARRLEHLISLALKFGTTDNFMPHPDQNIPWRVGEHGYNLTQMLKASSEIIQEAVPAIREIRYDFGSGTGVGRFVAADGRTVGDDTFKVLATSRGARAAQAGSGTLKRSVLVNTLVQGAGREGWRSLLGEIVRQSTVAEGIDPQLKRIFYSRPTAESDAVEQAQLWEDFQAVRAQFQTKQANTTAFQRWFGDGVEGITAKDGQPLTLYHGTPTEFYQFDISRSGLNSRHPTAGLGFFMTADKGAAYRYGGNILELHTKITKPYYLTDADLMDVDSVGAASQLRRKLQEKGYDGAVVSGPGMAPYVIAFESKQVKLTSNQNPTESADFRFSRPSVRYSSDEIPVNKNDAHAYRLAALAVVQQRYAGKPAVKITIASTGEPVMVGMAGVKHALRAGRPNWQTSLASLHVEDLLRQAEKIAVEPDRYGRKDPIATHRYRAQAVFDGVPQDVILIVREHSDGRRYYDHAVIEEKTPAGLYESQQPKLSDLLNLNAEANSSITPKQDDKNRYSRPGRPAPSSQDALPAETKAQAFQRQVQDKFNRFEVTQKWLKDKGINLTTAADVYGAESLLPKKTAAATEDARETILKPLVERAAANDWAIGGGQLIDAIAESKPLPTSFKPSITEYLHAAHAKERNAHIAKINPKFPDGGSGLTSAQADQILARYRGMAGFPLFQKLAGEFQAITSKTRDTLLKAGIISEEMAKAWSAAYQQYVPLKGGPEDGAQRSGAGGGISVNGKQKRALGHTLRDENIIENIWGDHERAIYLAQKQEVARALREMLTQANNEAIGTVGQPEKRAVLQQGWYHQVWIDGAVLGAFPSYADAKAAIAQDSQRTGRAVEKYGIRHQMADASVIYTGKPMLQDNEVALYENGQLVRLQLNDDLLARAARNLGADAASGLLKAGQSFNRWLSAAYTGYSPEFLVTNPIRDFTAGFINLTGQYGIKTAGKVLLNYPSAVRALWNHITTGADPLVDHYRQAGGSTGAAYLSDLERIGTDIKTVFQDMQGAKATWESGDKLGATRVAVADKLKIIGRHIENLNKIGENALRVATFKALLAQNYSEADAARAAGDVTVNFNRKGEITSQLGGLYLFFNPSIQGTKAMWDALAKGPHRTQAQVLTGALAGLALFLAQTARGGDEDDEKRWKALPGFTKDRNMVIPIGNGDYLTLAVPYGYGAFWGLGNIMSDLAHGEDGTKVGIRLASLIFENFSPVGNPFAGDEADSRNIVSMLPTALKPAVSLAMNRSELGRPIMPDVQPWNPSKPDSQRLWRSTQGTIWEQMTSALNRWTAGDKYQSGAVDVSPETLKTLWRTFTGGTGQFAADTLNLGAVLWQGAGKETTIRETPFLRKFVRQESIQDARTLFHEQSAVVREAQSMFSAAKRDNNQTAMQFIARENREFITLGRLLDAAGKHVKARRQLADAIERSDLPLAAKRRQLEGVEQQEAAIYSAFYSLFTEAKDAKKKRLAMAE